MVRLNSDAAQLYDSINAQPSRLLVSAACKQVASDSLHVRPCVENRCAALKEIRASSVAHAVAQPRAFTPGAAAGQLAIVVRLAIDVE